MDWKVLRNTNRDAEREHLNKILKEISETIVSGTPSSGSSVPGPRGPQGNPGAPGATGPAGPSGTSAFNRIDSNGDIRCDSSNDLRITTD